MQSIWPGSGSAASGSTPFALYDDDSEFQTEAPKFADWCAQRLGFPIVDIEMQDKQFYACLEESITEYSSQVNQFNIKDNLLSLQGQSTGSNLTHRTITNSMGRIVTLTEQYGTEAGVGGTVSFKTGSITLEKDVQTYDLNALWANVSESGNAIEIRKVFYEASPAVTRYFDPYAGTNDATNNLLDSFGWGNYSPSIQFLLQPIYADLLRIQAIEFNDQFRKSAYSFELRNNQIRIFPKPTKESTLRFQYIVKDERGTPFKGDNVGRISDLSNAPYNNMQYTHINDTGRQWIRKYGLALVKELLGSIRSKYASLPIPNAETSLDGDTLRNEAAAEKETLVTQLREILEQTSRKAMMEAERDESDALQEKLQKVPYPIYIG
tara:strand:+ start:238 stop:1377 length:1140 start_codon:yes stop_codon:yes gene_type:complete